MDCDPVFYGLVQFLFVIRSRSTNYEANMQDQYGAAQVVYFVGRYSAPN